MWKTRYVVTIPHDDGGCTQEFQEYRHAEEYADMVFYYKPSARIIIETIS